MAGAKEIRKKIKSIQSTRKITKAMEMVAASKMRKAQNRMRASRPYRKRAMAVIGHLLSGRLEYDHPFLHKRDEERNIGFIVITSDRGLCGGLNTNLYKLALSEMAEYSRANKHVKVCAIGKKGVDFFHNIKADLVASLPLLGDAPTLKSLIGPIKVMVDHYLDGSIDKLFLFYNEFVNTMTQKPRCEQILPIVADEKLETKYSWDYLYEPEAKILLDAVLERYIDALVYQGAVENVASEQSARMVAMKSASDNAAELIKDFGLIYNKARQAAITQEISEIVSGAAAV